MSALSGLSDEQRETVRLALGDAVAYRVGDGSTEPIDVEMAAQYEALAAALGMELDY